MTKDIFDLVASLEADPDRPRAPTFRRPRDQGALRLLALNRGSGASSTFLPRHGRLGYFRSSVPFEEAVRHWFPSWGTPLITLGWRGGE
jgi:hypothetical protein